MHSVSTTMLILLDACLVRRYTRKKSASTRDFLLHAPTTVLCMLGEWSFTAKRFKNSKYFSNPK